MGASRRRRRFGRRYAADARKLRCSRQPHTRRKAQPTAEGCADLPQHRFGDGAWRVRHRLRFRRLYSTLLPATAGGDAAEVPRPRLPRVPFWRVCRRSIHRRAASLRLRLPRGGGRCGAVRKSPTAVHRLEQYLPHRVAAPPRPHVGCQPAVFAGCRLQHISHRRRTALRLCRGSARLRLPHHHYVFYLKEDKHTGARRQPCACQQPHVRHGAPHRRQALRPFTLRRYVAHLQLGHDW